MKQQRAQLGAVTPMKKELNSLPQPKEKIVAAVYKFRDQTGQYKPSENGANWSTAVTQGTTSILIKALEESGWFVPIEREGLANLLNERKIIRSSRANYSGDTKNSQLLPPLLFAGVVLEGGIISYDANVITGGAGLKYFGAGGSGQYRQDRVTVYLRAISTGNGRVLKTVYTSKTLLSQKVDAGLFRYVKFKRILEAETGFTYNEPTEMAVKEAIEMAVKALVFEGIVDGLWEVKESSEINEKILQEYLTEKQINEKSDIFNQYFTPRRQNFGISAFAGGLLYQGDYNHARIKPSVGLSIMYDTRKYWMFSLTAMRGQWGARDYSQTFNAADFTTTYRFLPYKDWTPYFFVGMGIVIPQGDNFWDIKLPDKGYAQALYGMGVELLLGNDVGLNFSLSNHYLMSDKADGRTNGHFDDYYWEARMGVSFYLEKLWGRKKRSANKRSNVSVTPMTPTVNSGQRAVISADTLSGTPNADTLSNTSIGDTLSSTVKSPKKQGGGFLFWKNNKESKDLRAARKKAQKSDRLLRKEKRKADRLNKKAAK